MPTSRPTLIPTSSRPRAVLAPGGPGPALTDAWHIPLTAIDLNPHQARQHFDEAALGELTASVQAHGVLEPILVRPVGDTDRYEILAGERRYRAAQAAGLGSIPALVRSGLSDGEARVITALENLQREDLLPGDEARQYAHLITELGISQRELARRLGINHQRIAKLLTILEKGPQLLAAIDAGSLTINTALGQLDTGYYSPTILSRPGTELPAVGNPDPNYNPTILSRPGTADRNTEPPTTGEGLLYGADATPDPPTDLIAIHSQAGTHLVPTSDDRPAPRVSRHELIAPDQAVDRAYRPARHFANYASRLQPTDVPPPQRLPLAEELEAAAREATLLARALRQAAGQVAD